MTKTKIEWATDVWNPTVGCTKVSQGCKNCYAERDYGHWFPEVNFSQVQLKPERLEQPLHWKKPRKIFVDSVSDLFHKDVPDEFIGKVFQTMYEAYWHTFMILTKRPERMCEFVNQGHYLRDGIAPLPNVWLGVSVEDQKTADERVPLLFQTPACIRFVSAEPMLGPINIWDVTFKFEKNGGELASWSRAHLKYYDWIICGCESGRNARVMEMRWARDLKDQCAIACVPFFFKQAMIDGKLVKMPVLDGTVWAEYPEGVSNERI